MRMRTEGDVAMDQSVAHIGMHRSQGWASSEIVISAGICEGRVGDEQG